MPKNLVRIQKAKKRRRQYGAGTFGYWPRIRIAHRGTDVSKNTLD